MIDSRALLREPMAAAQGRRDFVKILRPDAVRPEIFQSLFELAMMADAWKAQIGRKNPVRKGHQIHSVGDIGWQGARRPCQKDGPARVTA
jgi:hypothetical protein